MAVKRSSGLKTKGAAAGVAATEASALETPVAATTAKARSSSSRSTSPRTSKTVKHKTVVETQSSASAVATLAQAVAKEPATPTQEEIARLAYFYWQERGCPHGDSMRDWLRAEHEVLSKYQAQFA